MKQRLAWFSVLLLLTACFGNTEDVQTNLQSVETPQISIKLPNTWVKTPTADSLLSYTSPTFADGFANNINILTEALPTPTTLNTYAHRNLSTVSAKLVNYNLKEEGSFAIANQTAYKLHFSGQVNTTAAERQFIQLYVIIGQRGYILTLALNTNEDATKYNTILHSWNIRN